MPTQTEESAAALEPRPDESPDDFMQRLQQEGTVEQKDDAQPEAGTDEAKAEADTAKETKITFQGKEFTESELATLIATGERASEIEKGAREKFDAAAAQAKALEAEAAELADMRTVWNAWVNGTPEEKAALVKYLAEETGLTLSEAEAQIEAIDEQALTENELKLHRQNQALSKQVAQLNAALSQLGTQVKGIAPTLEEIREFTSSEREARQMQADLKAIKDATGIDVSPEKVKAWRENGVSDPVKFAQNVLVPELQSAVKAGADKARKQDEVPDKTLTDTVDPNDPNTTPEALFADYMRKSHVPGW